MRVAALLCALVLGGCRDGVEPFRPEPLPDQSTGRRTFSVGHDLDPTWLPGGDSLIYGGETFPGVPASAGLLLRLPLDGGPARVLFPALQSPAFGGPRWLAQPAVSPGGDRIAFVQLARVVQPRPAGGQNPCFLPEPLLDSVALHVRSIAGDESPTLPAAVGFETAGRDPDQDAGLPGPYLQTVHPFQFLFAEEQYVAFRPSWSPDGQRLVFSDGLGLYIHTLGGGVGAISNVADGVSPAWSPNGEWIAFTRIVRGDAVTYACDVAGPPGTTLHIRTGYPNAQAVLSLIRPDGTGLRTLGEGWDAAWSPDGYMLFFRRADRIWRSRPDGGEVEFVAGTERGRMPAASPDGARIAFARRSDAGDWDIWVVDLAR